MSLATISVNFATINEINTGSITNKSLSPSVLKTFLTQGTGTAGTGFIYNLSVGSANFTGPVNYNTLTINSGQNLSVNTTALRVDATNNRVGINNSTPLDRLHISQPAGDFIQFSGQKIGHDNTGPYIRLNNTTDTFQVADAGLTNFVTINNSGLVGINTSPQAGYALNVLGGILATSFAGNGGSLTNIITPGAMFDYVGSTAPSGWLFCEGQVCPPEYTALINFLNTAGAPYGTSGGVPLLPNFTNRIVVGAGQGPGLTNRSLGATGGQETVLLTANQSGIPAHTHLYPVGQSISSGSRMAGSRPGMPNGPANNTRTNTWYAGGTSAATAHNNLMPFIVIRKIIRAI